MFALLPALLSATLVSAPFDKGNGAEEGIVLHEPKSGATLTLPQDWTFVKGEEGLTAVSEDERGYCVLLLESVPAELAHQARLGEENCPEQAITVEDE